MPRRHRAAELGIDLDQVGIGRPRAARQHLFDAGLVIEIADARGMVQQLPQRDAEAGELRNVLSERIVRMQLAQLDQDQDAERGELLAATCQMEDRVRRDPPAPDVGEPVAGRVDQGRALHDAEREPGAVRRDLLRQIVVDLPRALRLGADARFGRGAAAIPERHRETRAVSQNARARRVGRARVQLDARA